MTSKLVVNTIEADTGISSVSFASSISLTSTSKFHFSAAGLDIDGDTNINRPSAGVIGFNINGSEAARINANGFSGNGSQLTGLPAGLGTALSSTQTSPLNKLYYTDRVLSIGSTVTVDHPASATGAYTQYADIQVEDNADLIVADGDDLIPDILGLGGNGSTGAGGAGRLLVDNIVNRSATGAPTFPNGAVVTGIVTATSFSGSGANLTGLPIIPSVVRVIRSDYQVLANSTDTVINFDNDSSGSSFDTNNFYNTSNYRFTPTIAGYYQLTAQLEFSLNSGNNMFGVMIFKNGSEALRVRRWNDGSNSNVNINVTGIVAFNGSSDYAQAYGWQNSGGNITVAQGVGRTFFEGVYLRALV